MENITIRSIRTGADRTVHWGILVAVDKKSYIVKFLEGVVEYPLLPGTRVWHRSVKALPFRQINPGWRATK